MASKKKQHVDHVKEAKELAGAHNITVVPKRIENLGAGDENETPKELTKQFDDDETGDVRAVKAEQADPDDKRNSA